MMDPIRIIYHPAPSPTSDGGVVDVPPVNLGTDHGFALTWIRRRLGIAAPPDTRLLRFSAEVVPLPEAVTPKEEAPLFADAGEQEATISAPLADIRS